MSTGSGQTVDREISDPGPPTHSRPGTHPRAGARPASSTAGQRCVHPARGPACRTMIGAWGGGGRAEQNAPRQRPAVAEQPRAGWRSSHSSMPSRGGPSRRVSASSAPEGRRREPSLASLGGGPLLAARRWCPRRGRLMTTCAVGACSAASEPACLLACGPRNRAASRARAGQAPAEGGGVVEDGVASSPFAPPLRRASRKISARGNPNPSCRRPLTPASCLPPRARRLLLTRRGHRHKRAAPSSAGLSGRSLRAPAPPS
eukprot:scaffold51_cov401-Prasinococcus_capsulatus_cf.AAC.29